MNNSRTSPSTRTERLQDQLLHAHTGIDIVEYTPSTSDDLNDSTSTTNVQTQTQLITTRALAPGDLAFDCSPLHRQLFPRYWSSLCQRCWQKTGKHLSRCSKCRRVRYCSRDCQRKDWANQHRFECAALAGPILEALGMSDSDLNLNQSDDSDLRLSNLLLFCRHSRLDERLSSGLDELVHDSHYSCATTSRLPLAVLRTLRKHPELFHENPTSTHDSICERDEAVQGQWTKVQRTFHQNNFAITDALLNAIGTGVYLVTAMMNHDCASNCVLIYDPTTSRQFVRALSCIRAGEPLTHAYVDMATPRISRQDQLRAQYGFHCHCQRCARYHRGSETTIVRKIQTQMQCLASNVIFEGASSFNQQNYQDFMQKLHSLGSQNHVHKDNILLDEELREMEYYYELMILSQWFTHELTCGRWTEALDVGKRIATLYEHVYPTFHPLLGLHYYTLGDIAREVQSADLDYHTRAHQNLQMSFGPSHAFVQALEDMSLRP